MSTTHRAAKSRHFSFPYLNCRNISAPEDEAVGRKVYTGHAPASSVLELEDNENVREYLVDAPGKAKRKPTLVHQAIRKTLVDTPDVFSILNGGMVIVARRVEVDDKNKVLLLDRPSIINGSQTQGELKRYFDIYQKSDDFVVPSIKYELIVTDDDDLIAEISISRNFQNDVRPISIAGRRGQLDDLERAVQKVIPGAKLRKSETDIVSDDDNGFTDTEKLIQVGFALMPTKLLECFDVAGNKTFTYSQKTRCLKLFQKVVDESDGEFEEVYRYFIEISGPAWLTYQKWKSHQGFYGTRLRSIERDSGEIIDVPDGIVFPILASLSAFVSKTKRGWSLEIPKQFDEQELIEASKQAYMEIASSNPQTMGKSRACYSTLHRVTSIYAKLIGKN